jgi:hypothetical protein
MATLSQVNPSALHQIADHSKLHTIPPLAAVKWLLARSNRR